MRVLDFTCEVFLFATTRTKEAKYGICRYAGDRRMPQRGFNPRLCLGWLDELVASHAGSRRPLLSTACDTARCNQPVIEGRDNSRPFLFGDANQSRRIRALQGRTFPLAHRAHHYASLSCRTRVLGLIIKHSTGTRQPASVAASPIYNRPWRTTRRIFSPLLIIKTILLIENLVLNLHQNKILIFYKVDKYVILQ